MLEPELQQRITTRRAELDDELEEQRADVRAAQDELPFPERDLERVSEQIADERASATAVPGKLVRHAAAWRGSPQA
ncbi:hypothetical protein [Streptomyces goshikiensis]|uniref:hypothetical protein n=1 Tax=Streptomyces goshikiensis TaxID=1942 RepID=UPI00380F0141